jgi:hypothetical protein
LVLNLPEVFKFRILSHVRWIHSVSFCIHGEFYCTYLAKTHNSLRVFDDSA